MNTVTPQSGPPTDVILGGGKDANKATTTFVPNQGPSAVDKGKDFKASRMDRFGKIVDGIKTGAVSPAKVLANAGVQQVQSVAAPGETTPADPTETTGVEELPTGEVAGADAPQDTVGQDVTGGDQPDDRMARIQAAQARVKADAARNKQRVIQNRNRDLEAENLRQRNFQLQQQAQRGQQIENLWRTNPLEAAKLSGISPEQLVQRSLQDGSPEGQIEQLKQLVLQESQERRKLAQTLQQKDYEIGLHNAEENLWRRACNAEKYPHLASQPKKVVVEMAKAVAKEAKERYLRQTGTVPPLNDGMILRYLNGLYDATGSQTTTGATGSKATGTQKSGTKAATGSTKAGTAPRTLTNRLTNGSSRPANWASLPRADRVKWMKEEARKP